MAKRQIIAATAFAVLRKCDSRLVATGVQFMNGTCVAARMVGAQPCECDAYHSSSDVVALFSRDGEVELVEKALCVRVSE